MCHVADMTKLTSIYFLQVLRGHDRRRHPRLLRRHLRRRREAGRAHRAEGPHAADVRAEPLLGAPQRDPAHAAERVHRLDGVRREPGQGQRAGANEKEASSIAHKKINR